MALVLTKRSAEKLQGSNYADDIERMVEHFDNSAKLRFKESSSPAFIKFGTARDKDPKYDIKGGVLKLAGYVWIPVRCDGLILVALTVKTLRSSLIPLLTQ